MKFYLLKGVPNFTPINPIMKTGKDKSKRTCQVIPPSDPVINYIELKKTVTPLPPINTHFYLYKYLYSVLIQNFWLVWEVWLVWMDWMVWMVRLDKKLCIDAILTKVKGVAK
jgi:hypothetical protein